MPKPLGLGFRVVEGAVVLGVTQRNRVADAIYDAVQEAVLSGWDVAGFRLEAASCWDLVLENERKRTAKEWEKP